MSQVNAEAKKRKSIKIAPIFLTLFLGVGFGTVFTHMLSGSFADWVFSSVAMSVVFTLFPLFDDGL